uniref:F-box domain-containing protein n=1 Tax=Panagrellus redivivus TaxID=6233 RepID=A0A7E4VJE8_PANRE
MNSTLKPHLIVETLARQRKCMSPQKLCELFLAIGNFSEVFALAFRHHYKVRHSRYCEELDKDNFVIATRRGLVFQFNKNFHIPALLRIAGRLIHEMDTECPDEPWFEPFFEGLDDNECMEYIQLGAGPRFLEKYLRNHDKLPKVEFGDFSLLDKLGSPQIDTLVIEEPSNDKNLKPCRIAAIECSKSIWTDVNPLGRRGASLKYDKKFLKSFTTFGELNFNTVLRYVKTTFPKAEELAFCRVRIPDHDRDTTQECIDRLNTSVDDIWAAMLAHSGSVGVRIFYNPDSEMPMIHLTEACRNGLEGYTITEDDNFLRCTTFKEEGNKKLAVIVYFSTSRF